MTFLTPVLKLRRRGSTKTVMTTLALAAMQVAQAHAGPVPCAKAGTPAQKAAVAGAAAWYASHWQQSGHRWFTAYQLKPAPALPLGIGSLKGAGSLPETVGAGSSGPIRGLASVSSVLCTAYELSTDQTYVVRYTGRQLSFNENAEGWSRPLPKALLHVIEVQIEATRVAVTPMTTAQTALPPDAQLSRPSPLDIAPPSGTKRRR